MYMQCKLKYKNGGTSVLWLEKDQAKRGKRLFDEELEANCVVTEVYDDNPKTKKEFHTMERMFKSFKDHDGSYK